MPGLGAERGTLGRAPRWGKHPRKTWPGHQGLLSTQKTSTRPQKIQHRSSSQLHLRYPCSPGQTTNACFVWSSNFRVWRQNNFKCKSLIALKSGQKASALVGTLPSRTPIAMLTPAGCGELSQAACSRSTRPPRASRKAGQEPNECLSCPEYNS